MTDKEIIATIAEAMGWKDLHVNARDEWFGIVPGESRPPKARLPDWLNSRDALQPVIEKMTEGQKERLVIRLNLLAPAGVDINASPFRWTFWLLTLPPRTLAEAVAEVLRETKGEVK